ncbi:MAG: hypothetical protein DRN20_00355 [Thermoplasmata archaeon]|nr:MAG: hypothetical protein DRN20_00355 [Thermoplasmata archaeon]
MIKMRKNPSIIIIVICIIGMILTLVLMLFIHTIEITAPIVFPDIAVDVTYNNTTTIYTITINDVKYDKTGNKYPLLFDEWGLEILDKNDQTLIRGSFVAYLNNTLANVTIYDTDNNNLLSKGDIIVIRGDLATEGKKIVLIAWVIDENIKEITLEKGLSK